MRFPLDQKIQSGYRFGQKTFYNNAHSGTDYKANYVEGYVPFNSYVTSGWGVQGGYWITFKRDNGDEVTVRHLSKIILKSGYRVEGELAFITGNTGLFTTSAHAHIEVKVQGRLVDPESYFTKVIQVKLVQFLPPWPSMAEKFKDIRTRLLEASGGIYDINIDVDYSDLKPPITSEGYAGQGISIPWYQANVLPHKKSYDVVCSLSERTSQTFGWSLGNGRLQVFSNETDVVFYPDYGEVNYFVHSFIHELCHHIKELNPPDRVHYYLNDSALPKGLFDLKGALK